MTRGMVSTANSIAQPGEEEEEEDLRGGHYCSTLYGLGPTRPSSPAPSTAASLLKWISLRASLNV